MRYQIILLFSLTSALWASNLPSPKSGFFGAYVDQNIKFNHALFEYENSMTNGEYMLEFGWLEPLVEHKKGMFKGSFLNPGSRIQTSPYSSLYAFFFNLRFLQWAEISLGYHRTLYHKSLITFSAKPELEDWKPVEIISRIPQDGQLTGSDVFTFETRLLYQNPWFFWFGNLSLEQWNVNARSTKYVYEFSQDILIPKRSDIVSYHSGLSILPTCPWPPSFYISGLYINDAPKLYKSEVGLGFSSVPILSSTNFTLSALAGYITHHPQVTTNSFYRRLTMNLELSWKVKFIAE